MKRNTDLYGGIFMIFVSLVFMSKLKGLTEFSKVFPRAIIVLLIVSGVGLLIKARKKPSLSQLFQMENKKSVLFVTIVTLVWVFSFKKIGFVVTSIVCLTTLLCLLNDKKNMKEYMKSLVIAGCEIAILYLLFSRVLYVPFPNGLFF